MAVSPVPFLPDETTVSGALRRARLSLGGSEAGRGDAELLMARALGCTRAGVLAAGRRTLPDAARRRFDRLVERRRSGEPLAYVVGDAGFLDFTVRVTPDVLIPRQDTEVLALWAIARGSAMPGRLQVADVGTGCGALALALARSLPQASVHATDVSPSALGVARSNARSLGLGPNIHFHAADMFPRRPARFDLVVANLPYVAESEVPEMDPEVLRYEPRTAVMAGPDGLDAIRRLLIVLPGRLAPGGAAGVEIGWRQGAAVSRLAARAFPAARVEVLTDLAGRDRVVTLETRSDDGGPRPGRSVGQQPARSGS